jgi:signal transduction histidine kinase
MRERAELHGGTLAAGPTADGGFAVRAELPVAADVTGRTT